MEDPEMGAQQPLLRRSSSRVNERLQYQESQRQAVVDVARGGQGFFARFLEVLFWLTLGALLSLWVYVYVGSLNILFFHMDKPCDQPLGVWLLIWFILPTLHSLFDPPPPRDEGYETERSSHSFRQAFVHVMWFIVGYMWVIRAKTCQETNGLLYLWVRFVINVYVVGLVVFLVFPLMLAFFCLQVFRFYQTLIDYGWISNPKAADAETIDSLEVVAYDPSLFASEYSDPTDKRPSAECCCCSENFGPELEIVRTPCYHYYHKACLGEWLKLARSCPLCRADLNPAAPQDSSPAASPDSMQEEGSQVEDSPDETARESA